MIIIYIFNYTFLLIINIKLISALCHSTSMHLKIREIWESGIVYSVSRFTRFFRWLQGEWFWFYIFCDQNVTGANPCVSIGVIRVNKVLNQGFRGFLMCFYVINNSITNIFHHFQIFLQKYLQNKNTFGIIMSKYY